MKAYAITIKDNLISERGTENLINSSKAFGNDFDIEIRNAVVPGDVEEKMLDYSLTWNYPWDKPILDIQSGLLKSPYRTQNRNSRIATALSHYELWVNAYGSCDNVLVMEHDAIFTRRLTNKFLRDFEESNFLIAGINDPRGATRKSLLFHDKIQYSMSLDLMVTPEIDNYQVPQGLAGNSAYIIKPEGGELLMNLVDEYGLWPNDAIMCRQLVPGLGVSTKYYTKVQGLPSTTT